MFIFIFDLEYFVTRGPSNGFVVVVVVVVGMIYLKIRLNLIFLRLLFRYDKSDLVLILILLIFLLRYDESDIGFSRP